MTVVACRVDKCTGDIEIASDSQTTYGQTQFQDNVTFSKLYKSENGIIIGSAGRVQDAILLKLFLKTNRPLNNTEDSVVDFFDKFYNYLSDKTTEYTRYTVYIMVINGKAYEVYDYSVVEIKTYSAIGSGMEYALGALYLEHTVEKAVETAIALNIYCEMPIIKFKMKGKKND